MTNSESPPEFMDLRLEVTEEDNPRFYSLFQRGNDLMAAANEVFNDLNQWRPPQVQIRRARKKMASLAKATDKLWEDDFEPWELEVINFLFQPMYGNIPVDHATLFFLHTTQALRDQLSRVERHVLSLRQNVLLARNAVANREARVYAIAALLLSAASFVLAAVALSAG